MEVGGEGAACSYKTSFILFVAAPFLSLSPLSGMTFPFLSHRNLSGLHEIKSQDISYSKTTDLLYFVSRFVLAVRR